VNELFIVYDTFWGQFINRFGSLPTFPPGSLVNAHRSGNPAMDRLPNGQFVPARFPYIVYDVIQPGLFGNAVSSVSIWDRDLMPNGAPGRPNFYGRVNDIAEQILGDGTEEKPGAIPVGGVSLKVGKRGFITLYRGSVLFQIAPTGEHDATFVRAIINLTIRGRLF